MQYGIKQHPQPPKQMQIRRAIKWVFDVGVSVTSVRMLDLQVGQTIVVGSGPKTGCVCCT